MVATTASIDLIANKGAQSAHMSIFTNYQVKRCGEPMLLQNRGRGQWNRRGVGALIGGAGWAARQRVERCSLSFWAGFGLEGEFQAAERRSKRLFRAFRSYKTLLAIRDGPASWRPPGLKNMGIPHARRVQTGGGPNTTTTIYGSAVVPAKMRVRKRMLHNHGTE